jgi:hypothetical protein
MWDTHTRKLNINHLCPHQCRAEWKCDGRKHKMSTSAETLLEAWIQFLGFSTSIFPYIPFQLSSHSDFTNVGSDRHFRLELEENTRVARVLQVPPPMKIVSVELQQHFKLLQQPTDEGERILEGRQKFNMGIYVYTNSCPS